jgi:hypothetical protein
MNLAHYNKMLEIAKVQLENKSLTQKQIEVIKIRMINIQHNIDQLKLFDKTGLDNANLPNDKLIENPIKKKLIQKVKVSFKEKLIIIAAIATIISMLIGLYELIVKCYPHLDW